MSKMKFTEKEAWRVEVWEHERGWGRRQEDILYFADKSDADAYIKKYNASNTELVVPDWYMVASGPYKTKFVAEVK